MSDAKLSFLLVDDDEEDYRITSSKLRQIEGLDFDLQWVSTYEEAVQALTDGKHTLCITDYNLQRVKTGLDLVDEMTQRNCTVPFIVLTGQSTLALCVEAGKKGAVDFLDKGSLTTSQLSGAIQSALSAMRTVEQLRETEAQLRRLSET
jgi:FixJ family two-component response regulator